MQGSVGSAPAPVATADPGGRHIGRSAMLAMVWLSIFIPGHMFGWALEQAFIVTLAVVPIAVVLLLGRFPARFAGVSLLGIGLALLAVTVVYLLAYLSTLMRRPIATGVRDQVEIGRRGSARHRVFGELELGTTDRSWDSRVLRSHS